MILGGYIMDNIIQQSKAGRMFGDIKHLAGLGNRFAGSEVEYMAGNLVSDTFKESGIQVIEEEFPIKTFNEEYSFIKVNGEVEIPSRAMFFSESTCDEGLKGELVYVNKGLEEDYKGKSVRGKIVVFNRDNETMKDQFWPEICSAAKHGAIGAILINFDPWTFITTLETGYFESERRFLPINPEPIPAVVIDCIQGDKLLKIMEGGPASGTLVVKTENKDGHSVNIRGIKKGNKTPDERIIIYGHRDSAGTPGANDNGSGTSIIMELARILKDKELNRTIEFISLGAEEQLGSAGSDAYIKKHKDDLGNIKAGIEIDMVAVGSQLWVMKGGNWPGRQIHFPEKLCNYVVDVAEEMGYYLEQDYCVLGTPDSGRFTEAGVPTTWIWGPGDKYYHSPEDKPERVDPNKLKVLADILATVICRLANAEKIQW
jgi:aminopeptidase YwaD